MLGQSSENSSVAAFHASESIRSSLYSSSPRAFSIPVPSELAAAHTYRRICQVPCALPERPFRLSASLLFLRSCVMALDCSSFRRDSIIVFSTQSSTVGSGLRDVPPAASFGGHGRFQIQLGIAWLLLTLVQVSPQITVPPLMSPLPSRS